MKHHEAVPVRLRRVLPRHVPAAGVDRCGMSWVLDGLQFFVGVFVILCLFSAMSFLLRWLWERWE